MWHIPQNVKFEFEPDLSIQVAFQLNLDYYTNVLQGACLYRIMKPGSATIKTIQTQTHRQASEIWEHIAMDSLVRVVQKMRFRQLPVCIQLSVFLSIGTV